MVSSRGRDSEEPLGRGDSEEPWKGSRGCWSIVMGVGIGTLCWRCLIAALCHVVGTPQKHYAMLDMRHRLNHVGDDSQWHYAMLEMHHKSMMIRRICVTITLHHDGDASEQH